MMSILRRGYEASEVWEVSYEEQPNDNEGEVAGRASSGGSGCARMFALANS